MRLRDGIFLLLAASAVTLPMPRALAAPLLAETTHSMSDLARLTALEDVFVRFGSEIATMPSTEALSTDKVFLGHWEATARQCFNATLLLRRLERMLEAELTDTDREALVDFYDSAFGRRMIDLERQASRMDAVAQSAAIRLGERLLDVKDDTRSAGIDEMLHLLSADIYVTTASQTVRALLLGMSMSHQHGAIEVPWVEIDAQIEAMLPGLEQELANAQRAMTAYTFIDLDDADFERYLAFLRTEPARRFHALTTYAVGQIVSDEMARFGARLAERLARVDI